LPYQDHGQFHVSLINPDGREITSLDVNKIVKIDTKSLPIDDIQDPLITCCFIRSDALFVCVYHRIQRKQYHFTYDMKTKQASKIGIVSIQDATAINFPLRSFYSSESKKCFTFYRQGQATTARADALEDIQFEKMTSADLGDMYLAFEKALIVRSSNSILIFKVDPETKLWRQYHKINNMRGQIFFIRGNIRF